MLFKGLGTALVTPFEEDGSVDFASLEKLVDNQLKGGVDALVVCGTTGEPPTLTDSEKSQVIRFVARQVNGRIPVIAGTGSNCTATAAENSRRAEDMGADGVLVVTPYYNKCTQGGLVEHYRAVASATSLPVIAYNVPGRTGVNLLPATAARLTEVKGIVGIKEASGNITQVIETSKAIEGSDISLYSGDDAAALPIFAVGGKGLISVASNAVPAAIKELTDACLAEDYATARGLQFRFQKLFELMFCEVNPIPVKAACAMLGLCKPCMRLPLTPATPASTALIREEMKALGFIKE